MCDINRKTKLKTKTIYKVVKVMAGRYFGPFSGYEIKLGPVAINWEVDTLFRIRINNCCIPFQNYKNYNVLFNDIMIGKISGFQSKKAANELFKELKEDYDKTLSKHKMYHTILAIELSGEIWKGTSANISSIPDNHFTFAGSEVLSITEVK